MSKEALECQQILSYIYSGTLYVSLDKVQPLYQAADLLQLDYVRDTCSSYMAMNVERSTCVDLYKFADVFSVDIVLKSCWQWIAKHFTEVVSSVDFFSLSVDQLTEIISHDELDDKEETTVWEAVVRWVQHSKEDRLHHLPSILPHIRFNLLTSDDTAAILDHPLVREDPGSCEVIKTVVQKRNSNLKARLGMTTEMVMLSHVDSKELLFMNPREGKYISCSYKSEDLPSFTDVTVTSDNNIYVLTRDRERNNELSVFKYNHAANVWEHAGMSSVSKWLQQENGFRYYNERLVEVDGVLFYLAGGKVEDSGLVWMRKYNCHTDQWQECSQLKLDYNSHYQSAALSCSSHLYFIASMEVHRYDPKQDCWCKRATPIDIAEVCSAVVMGTEIFCTDGDFSQTLVYDTESDCWQELEGWPNTENLGIDIVPSLFVLDNRMHVLLNCTSESEEAYIYLLNVYDRSADTWSDVKASLPYKRYYGQCSPVARIYLPYLKGA
ncbi:kelch repeat and BTB domain-containing protein 8-like [Branchiostoma floridae]|uniref:Kelch repeat and BTB domain-containing protein 8-like n=1 Tax=Branchiostoma floridae TaxID=7739 RepID=A0A9J7N0X3_BRAFL|nr:kelch repeat and BTB domain-containing protein 8-like [Branchiostoma floridae]